MYILVCVCLTKHQVVAKVPVISIMEGIYLSIILQCEVDGHIYSLLYLLIQGFLPCI